MGFSLHLEERLCWILGLNFSAALGLGFDFLGGVRVGVRGMRGVRVVALGISKVMEIPALCVWGGGPTPKPSKWIRADWVCGPPRRAASG